MQDVSTTTEYPPNLPFVPPDFCSVVLEWGHTSHVACHPGYRQTLSLVQQHFWWPSMVADTREFVVACSICARGKSSHHTPAGLLRPLPTLSCPRSHITTDFIPQETVSDQGPQFPSQVWKAFYQVLRDHRPTARWSGPTRTWSPFSDLLGDTMDRVCP